MHLPLVSICVSVYIEPDLEYTIIRPAWLADTDEVTYSTTGRHDRFKSTEVSRKSVAVLVVRCIGDPKNFIQASRRKQAQHRWR
ncbi:MAG: NAD(P)H-binding protein [Acidobacteriota bacterium]|nr:NAD(P)H-binding protein [Acidobacteriota bacterium]